jgi:hypothetical protein
MFLVPVRRLVELGSSLGQEKERQRHCCNRASASALICSQGITSFGAAA